MISIIIPCRNRAENITNCVRSILNQTHKDLELIVVDYGGRDNTAQVLDSFEDQRIRYIYVPEQDTIWNLPRARNCGIRASVSG